jgi:hypothetical protein
MFGKNQIPQKSIRSEIIGIIRIEVKVIGIMIKPLGQSRIK